MGSSVFVLLKAVIFFWVFVGLFSFQGFWGDLSCDSCSWGLLPSLVSEREALWGALFALTWVTLIVHLLLKLGHTKRRASISFMVLTFSSLSFYFYWVLGSSFFPDTFCKRLQVFLLRFLGLFSFQGVLFSAIYLKDCQHSNFTTASKIFFESLHEISLRICCSQIV